MINVENPPKPIQSIGEKILNFFTSLGKKKTEDKGATHGNMMTKQQTNVAVGVGIVSMIAVCVYGFITYQKNNEINQGTNELLTLATYEIAPDEALLKPYGDGFSTVDDLFTLSENVADTLNSYNDLAKEQSSYYNMVLRYLYFPRLNIWKNPYTNVIDPTIIGQRYLELDPFQNIPLIQYWSDFFKNVGEGVEYNEITSINVGDITDVDGEHFIVPVELSFTSPDKRSFLLLVNKLSTTSDTNNIALLNEFFFYLIKNIKENKQAEIQTLKTEYAPLFAKGGIEELDDDTVIGYHLYQWTKNDATNLLIDDALINKTIQENVLCDEAESDAACFYRFREKYRNLPYLTYTIGILNASDKTQAFEDFLKSLAPVITISDFSFEKMKNTTIDRSQLYHGRIKFNAYGQSMSPDDVNEIAEALGKLCFGEQEAEILPISPEVALERVNKKLANLNANNNRIAQSNEIAAMEEIEQLFTDIQSQYP
jgi:hypothetical protein